MFLLWSPDIASNGAFNLLKPTEHCVAGGFFVVVFQWSVFRLVTY
jgi:hypothetical protein